MNMNKINKVFIYYVIIPFFSSFLQHIVLSITAFLYTIIYLISKGTQ